MVFFKSFEALCAAIRGRHMLSPEVCESAYVAEANQGGEGVQDAVLAFGSGPKELRIILGSFPKFLPVSGVRNGSVFEESGIRLHYGKRFRIFVSSAPEVTVVYGVFDLLVRINVPCNQFS